MWLQACAPIIVRHAKTVNTTKTSNKTMSEKSLKTMECRTGRDKLAKISLHTLRNLHVWQLYDRSEKNKRTLWSKSDNPNFVQNMLWIILSFYKSSFCKKLLGQWYPPRCLDMKMKETMILHCIPQLHFDKCTETLLNWFSLQYTDLGQVAPSRCCTV